MTVLMWIAGWVGLSVPTALVVGPLMARANAELSVVSADEAEVAR